MKLKPSILLNLSLHICPLNYITKALCLIAITRYFICLLPWLVRVNYDIFAWCAQCNVLLRPRPNQFINGNKLKSCRTSLTNHTRPISHHIMPLVINALGGGHTDTHIPTCKQKRLQETSPAATAPGLKI